MVGSVDRWMGRWVSGWMGGCMDRWVGQWIDAFATLGDLPNLGIEPVSLALSGEFFTTEPPGKPVSLVKSMVKTVFSLRSELRN